MMADSVLHPVLGLKVSGPKGSAWAQTQQSYCFQFELCIATRRFGCCIAFSFCRSLTIFQVLSGEQQLHQMVVSLGS